MQGLIEEVPGRFVPLQQRLHFAPQLCVTRAGFGEKTSALVLRQFAGSVEQVAELLVSCRRTWKLRRREALKE